MVWIFKNKIYYRVLLLFFLGISTAKAISFPFPFLDSALRSDSYTDQVRTVYMENFEKIDSKMSKSSFNSFKEAYFLWVDNYIYELDKTSKQEFTNKIKKSLQVYIEESKKDNKELNPKDAMDFAMNKAFNDIDAHTTWISSKEAKAFKERLTGRYKGIGILFNFDKTKNMISVIKVFDNSPAKKAGLKKGDFIYAVNGKLISKDSKLEDVMNSIRGENGTFLDISIKRGVQDITFSVQRGDYYVPSVESWVLDNEYGYIKINSFNNDTANLFRVALNTMNVNSLRGLIIDVRGNPGGLLTAVVLISDNILSGESIVTIKGRTVQNNQTFIAVNNSVVKQNLPVAVLVNSMSASASELLAGALAMNNRATIIGENSFGKWSVQSSFTLKDSSIFNITTQLFYAPKNATFQGLGIAPDIKVLDEYSKYAIHEKDYKNYLKTEDINNVKREPKLTIEAKHCGDKIYENVSDNPDRLLNCSVMFLNSKNIKHFQENLR